MTAIELLSLLTRSSFLVVAALSVLDWLRHRDSTRLDIALVFVSLSASIPIQWLSDVAGYHAEWLSDLTTIAVLAHPLLLLRLVRHFRPVPSVQLRIAGLGLGLSALLTIALSNPLPVPATLVIVGYFGYVEGYAALAFLRGAVTTRGVRRQRLRLVSAGTGTLAVLILLAGAAAALPALGAALGALVQILAILAALAFYLGFSPPRGLARAWQLSELYAYLRVLANQPPDKPASERLDQLCLTAMATVGGIASAVALWDDDHQRITVRATNTPTLPLNRTIDADEGAIERARRTHQPTLAHTPAEFGADEARLAASLDARALLAVPIATTVRDWGFLLVFVSRAPLFAADDLGMLALFVEQTALNLDYGALLSVEHSLSEQLGQRSAQLEDSNRQLVSEISERQRVADAVRQLNADLTTQSARLEAANKELEAFSYSVSHDLRAPLRHVGGYVDLVLQNSSDLDEKNRRYLSIIAEAATRMGRLIDDLLAFSRVGRSELKRERVETRALVREVLTEFNQDTQGRQIDWQIDALPCLYGDRSMLRLVWANLIGNALKYTRTRPQAQIAIGCQANCTESVYFIRDNGVGFDMRYVNKLFGVFQRLHSATEFEGTGIGLANVRRIVARHDGKVWGEGLVDGGATFYFSLPNSTEE